MLRVLLRHDSQSVLPALYLMSNSLTPPYLPLELGLGPSIISKAVQHVSGLSSAALRKLYNRTGDPGDVAFEAKSAVRTLIPHARLSIQGVYSTLLKVARSKGAGAVKQKQVLVEKLLVSATGEESRFVVRTLSQNIRIGATRTTVLTALARSLVLNSPQATRFKHTSSKYFADAELLAKVVPLPTSGKKKADPDPARVTVIEKFTEAEAIIKRVFVQHPNFEDLTAALLEGPLDDIATRVPLTIGQLK